MDMYSRVKRRKSMRRNTFGMQAHHKAISKSKDHDEIEGTEGICTVKSTITYGFDVKAPKVPLRAESDCY